MAQDWLSDVRKYVANADEAVVAAIVRYLGIALQNRDSSLVSFSDKKETDRVRENFLKKKLGLTHSDAELDSAIASVGERMKEDRTKNRVTVYYLLAEKFGLLSLFGGSDGSASAAPLAAAAGLAGAAGLGATAGAASASAASEPVHVENPAAIGTTPAANYLHYSDDQDETDGGLGWLKWLLLGALLLALIFFALRYCTPHGEQAVTVDKASPAATTADAGTTPAPAVAAPAIPQGAGVVAADREGKPMLTVYFDTGKSEVSNDLSTAAANVKAYLDKNTGSKLAVSGFNDPTGNAAANAALSKKRAQGVQAALEKIGVPATSIELVKPADTTDETVDNTAARRVEVTIK